MKIKASFCVDKRALHALAKYKRLTGVGKGEIVGKAIMEYVNDRCPQCGSVFDTEHNRCTNCGGEV